MKVQVPKLILLGFAATLVNGAVDCTFNAVSDIIPQGLSLSFAQYIPENGTFTVPKNDKGWPTDPINLPELCAIGVMVPGETSNSTFGFGIFLPVNWNQRTFTVGNGGLAGGVNWQDMGTGVKYGHAVFSTDTGHNGTSTDATWAYQNPQSQANWGRRALHETVVYGKNITEAFYNSKPAYNYYQGCSTGGRQGFKEAQMFPDDFDGVIAGAPAWWTVISSTNMASLAWTIIMDPYGCNFNPETLLCAANVTDSTTCLTASQLATLDTITRDYIGGNSTMIFPHWLLGSEHFWDMNIDGGSPNVIGVGYIQYFLGLGADWDWRNLDEAVVQLSEQLNAGQADASDYNMSPFFNAGKKFIHYHGLSDGGIATGASFYLYDHINRAVSPQGIDLHDSYRFFPIPGMGHCTDTADYVNAPYYIAGLSMTNNGQYSVPGYHDAEHDVLYALMNWVENGTAPDYIIGTAFSNFTTQDYITRQRPICPYPQQARYNGSGDPDSPSSWECKLFY
ncbi:tannase and feruloyl esterase [Penicillium malachiteum]|nr:tannase and feruloyl esterase [Penicillium malachiteum]